MPVPDPEHSIVLTRRVNASPREIYAAWTDPPEMARWLGTVEADVRPGGRYRFETPAEDGQSHVHTGEYLVLEQDARVVQSFLAGEPDPAAANPYPNEFIELRIRESGPRECEVTFINGWAGERLSEEFRKEVEAAWSAWLERMENSLAERRA